jgi:hypothetical protein
MVRGFSYASYANVALTDRFWSECAAPGYQCKLFKNTTNSNSQEHAWPGNYKHPQKVQNCSVPFDARSKSRAFREIMDHHKNAKPYDSS